MLARLKLGETLDHFETVRVRKDGKEIQIELTVSPIRDALNNIVGASTIGRDISARKANEAQLLQKMEELSRSNEEWKQFTSIAADDLQEPLRMIERHGGSISVESEMGKGSTFRFGFASNEAKP